VRLEGLGKLKNSITSSAIGPPLWSSGQSSWLQIRRPGLDSRHYQKEKCSGSGTECTQPREYKLRSYLIEK
jgi:ribosomal protein L37E